MRLKMANSTSKKRMIDSALWDSEYYLSNHRDLRLLYTVIFTNQDVTLTGCYRISLPMLAFRCGMTVDEVKPYLEKLQADGKVIYRDGWMLARNFIDHQNTNNDQILAGTFKLLSEIPAWAIEVIRGDYPELFMTPDDSSVTPDESLHNLKRESNSDSETKDQKKSLSPAGSEIPTENFGRKTGIKVSDLNPEIEASDLATVLEGIRERTGYLVALPKEFEWISATERGFKNGFSPPLMLEVYDLLERIRKRKGGRWRITVNYWEENLARRDELILELNELNGSGTGANNTGTQKSGTKAAGGGAARRTFKSPELKRGS